MLSNSMCQRCWYFRLLQLCLVNGLICIFSSVNKGILNAAETLFLTSKSYFLSSDWLQQSVRLPLQLLHSTMVEKQHMKHYQTCLLLHETFSVLSPLTYCYSTMKKKTFFSGTNTSQLELCKMAKNNWKRPSKSII